MTTAGRCSLRLRRQGAGERRLCRVTFDAQAFAAVFGLSVFSGLSGSLLGMGGGAIVTPLLTAALGYPIRQVIGASLIAVIATSVGAAAGYVQDRLTHLRIAMLLELATASGAIVGAYLSGRLPVRWLYWMFAVLLAYSAFSMFQRRHLEGEVKVPDSPLARRLRLEGSYYDAALGRTVTYCPGRVGPGLAVMFAAGGVGGAMGISAGVFKVLGLDLVMGLPIKVSTTTSNFMVGVTGAAAAGIYLSRGEVDPVLAAPVALGVMAGASIGSRLLPRLRGRVLRYLFVPLLLYLAAEMAARGAAP